METEMRSTAVPFPGHFIKEELDARGWNQRDLAYILGCPEQSVTMILSGKRGISPEMAKALAKAFDIEPEVFINLQRAYDLSQARDPDPGVQRRAWLQTYPIREMIRRGWLENTEPEMLEMQMARFFEKQKAEDIQHLAHAAYKGPAKAKDDSPSPSQLAWFYRVRQIARTLAVPKYSEALMQDGLKRLHQLVVDPEELRYVPTILAQCGVRFVLVESLPSSKVDGVTTWIDHSPVIGLSLRHDRIDNFWFVLIHEIEHVLNRHGQRGEIRLDSELEGERASVTTEVSEEERVANSAAANFCFPDTELSNFITRTRFFTSEKDILGFAKRMQVHPGIVVGRFQYRTSRYDFLRKYQVKIRQFLVRTANVDGWGQVAQVAL